MDEEAELKIEGARKWSSFVMDDALPGKEKMKEKLQQLQKDLDEEFDVNEEQIFAYNFTSYLHWRLGNIEQAFAASKLAEELEEEPNLITCCNKIIFHAELEKHYCSKKLLEAMEIRNNIRIKRSQLRTTAEIGYCYSRLGPQHHDRAVQYFQRAIDGIAPERNILWEFRLALTLRRQSNIFQMTKPDNYRPDEKKKEAARLLYEILKFPTDGYCHLKARAWCELSKTLFKGKKLFEIIHTDPEETEKIDERRCFQEAMNLCPDHYFVLQEYGAYLRYTRDLVKSREMLERSIQLRDTTFARHHLALTLKKLVELDTPKPNYRRNLQFSYSLDERSNFKSRDSHMSSMPESLISMSSSSEHTEKKSIRHDDNKINHSKRTIIYERSKSTGSVGNHDYQPQMQLNTDVTKATAKNHVSKYAYFCVPKVANVSKSPLKCHHEENYTAENQQSVSLQKQEEKPFRQYQSDATDQKYTFISTRKSPRLVCVSQDNPLLLKAVEHLQRAIEMSQGFDVGRYDLGLLYRMLDRPYDALKCFSFITSNNCGKPSTYPMSLINAYEQQAICKLDLLAKETEPGKEEELKYDARKFLWKAVFKTSEVIGTIPLLKTTSHCFPALKRLLQDEEKSSETYKELAKLHELLDYNDESIKFYKQITEIECDSTSVRDLAQGYKNVGDFENALCTLALLQGELDISDKLFYVDTCLEGAKDSLRKCDLEMVKIRFLIAYRVIFSNQKVSASTEEQNSTAFKKTHNTPATKEEYNVSTPKEEQNTLAFEFEQNVSPSKEEQNAPASKEEQSVSTSLVELNISASKKEQNKPAFKEGQNAPIFIEEQNAPATKEKQSVPTSKKEQNALASKEENDDNTLDILVLHICGEDGCRYLNIVKSTLESFVQFKYAVNDNDCLPFRRRRDYLIEAMYKSRCILIIHHERNTTDVKKDEILDQALAIALGNHRAKTLIIKKEDVEHDEKGIKEVILSCDFDENVNTESSQILQGDLLSDLLKKISEM